MNIIFCGFLFFCAAQSLLAADAKGSKEEVISENNGGSGVAAKSLSTEDANDAEEPKPAAETDNGTKVQSTQESKSAPSSVVSSPDTTQPPVGAVPHPHPARELHRRAPPPQPYSPQMARPPPTAVGDMAAMGGLVRMLLNSSQADNVWVLVVMGAATFAVFILMSAIMSAFLRGNKIDKQRHKYREEWDAHLEDVNPNRE